MKKETVGSYKVVVYGGPESVPLVAFNDVSSVLLDGDPVKEDEVVVEAFAVKYTRDRKEVQVYTKK